MRKKWAKEKGKQGRYRERPEHFRKRELRGRLLWRLEGGGGGGRGGSWRDVLGRRSHARECQHGDIISKPCVTSAWQTCCAKTGCMNVCTHTHKPKLVLSGLCVHLTGCVCVQVCAHLRLCVPSVWGMQLHCSETQTSDQTQRRNKEETSRPSFNLHYTVHGLRSALWRGHPQSTQLNECVCVFCPDHNLLPSFLYLWRICCHGYQFWAWPGQYQHQPCVSSCKTVCVWEQLSHFIILFFFPLRLSSHVIQGLVKRMHFSTSRRKGNTKQRRASGFVRRCARTKDKPTVATAVLEMEWCFIHITRWEPLFPLVRKTFALPFFCRFFSLPCVCST